MGNFSKFPTCPPFSMLLSDYPQINLDDSTIKFSPCTLKKDEECFVSWEADGHSILEFLRNNHY